MLLTTLLVTASAFVHLPEKNPLSFPTYRQNVTVTYATEREAQESTCSIAPLPENAPLAFSCRWDDTNPRNVPKAEMMNRVGVKGSFYIVKADTNLCLKLAALGHCIGNHTDRHAHMPTVSLNENFRTIAAHRIELEEILGRTIMSYVSPYGWERDAKDPQHMRLVAECLLADGHFVSQDANQHWEETDPRRMMWTNRFAANDHDPQREKFIAGFQSRRAAAAKNALMPRVTLGTHAWCDEKGNADQEAWIREFCLSEDFVQLYDWSYGAYRYQYLHGAVSRTGVQGKTATFAIDRYPAAFVGDDIALSLLISGNPLSVQQNGRELAVGKRNTRLLEQDNVQGAMLTKVGRAIEGFSLTMTVDEQNAKMSVTFENHSGKDVHDLYLATALPPKWAKRRLTLQVGDGVSGASQAREFALGEIAAPQYAKGEAYYPLSADFIADGKRLRLWQSISK